MKITDSSVPDHICMCIVVTFHLVHCCNFSSCPLSVIFLRDPNNLNHKSFTEKVKTRKAL